MEKLTQEKFIIKLNKSCKANDKDNVKELLKKLKTFDEYADKVKPDNNALHIVCDALNNNPLDDRERHKTKKILKLLLYNNFNPNGQDDDGNTALHVLKPLNHNMKILKLFLDYGANLKIKNSNNADPYEFACEEAEKQPDYIESMKQQYRRWNNLTDYPRWQQDTGHRSKDIRGRYRYLFDGADENELQNSDGRFVFVIVHGTGISGESGCYNKDYYDLQSPQFQSFMNYAKEYVEQYNSTKELHEQKILHLISFEWNGNLLDTTSRKPAGLRLAQYLESWNYRNSKIVCIAHSHGCNVVNFASHELRNLKKKNSYGLYKGRIKELVFFAPPCRQIIPEEDRSSIINPLGKMYDLCNDAFSTKLTNYNQLFVFHSPADHVVELGSVDALTSTLVLSTVGTVGYYAGKTAKKVAKDGMPKTPEEQRDLLLGVFIAGGSTYAAYNAIKKKFKQAHAYNLSVPKNEIGKVKGPKVHIETMVNGKYIGHSSPELLLNFATALRILKNQYTLNLARCDDFKINIITKQIKQEKLLEFIEDKGIEELFDYSEDNDQQDQENASRTFWENRENNCNVQCRIEEKEESKPRKYKKHPYFKTTKEKLKKITNTKQSFLDITELISKKHQVVYEHYLSNLQQNSTDAPSQSCVLL